MGSLKIIFSPYRAFGESARNPHYWWDFLIICAGIISASLTIRPFTRKATVSYLANFVPPEDLEGALNSMDQWFIIGIAFTPVFLLMKCGYYTAMAWSLGSILGLWMDFKKTFGVVVSSSVVTVLESFCVWLILWLRGLEEIRGLLDLEVSLGLNLLIQSSNDAVFSLLGSFNPFGIWFVALLAVGVSRVNSISSWKGFWIALSAWLSAVLLQCGGQLLLARFHAVLS